MSMLNATDDQASENVSEQIISRMQPGWAGRLTAEPRDTDHIDNG